MPFLTFPHFPRLYLSLFTYVPAKLGEHKGYVSRQLGKHRNPNP